MTLEDGYSDSLENLSGKKRTMCYFYFLFAGWIQTAAAHLEGLLFLRHAVHDWQNAQIRKNAA